MIEYVLFVSMGVGWLSDPRSVLRVGENKMFVHMFVCCMMCRAFCVEHMKSGKKLSRNKKSLLVRFCLAFFSTCSLLLYLIFYLFVDIMCDYEH